MLKGIACLLMGASLVGGYYYYHDRASAAKAQIAEQAQEPEAKPEAQDADKTALVAPLAPVDGEEEPGPLRKPEPRDKPHPSDHIAESPVGTSTAIVRKTFGVSAPAKFSFEVPAHAASPQCTERFIRLCAPPEFNPATKAPTSICS